MNTKIKEIKTLCDHYHLTLVIKYYGRSTNFVGINDDEQEVFNVCVHCPNRGKRIFYIEVNSSNEHWAGGKFTKEDMLLLLSIDELSDAELNINQIKMENENNG